MVLTGTDHVPSLWRFCREAWGRVIFRKVADSLADNTHTYRQDAAGGVFYTQELNGRVGTACAGDLCVPYITGLSTFPYKCEYLEEAQGREWVVTTFLSSHQNFLM